MKKILLVAAIAALSQQAAAVSYNISSDIPDVGGVQFWMANPSTGAELAPESMDVNGFSIDGTINDTDNDGVPDAINITMVGDILMTLPVEGGGGQIHVVFNLTSDSYTAGEGVVMTGGLVEIEVDLDGDGFAPFPSIDPTEKPVEFLLNGDGFIEGCPGQCLAGLLLEGFSGDDFLATRNLPGFYSGEGGEGRDSGIGTVEIVMMGGLFLQGTVTRVPVPVPAAAWLFGSALLGLAGVGRRKK